MESCPNLEECPMHKWFNLQTTSDFFIQQYCKGNYEKCARKKLKDNRKDVPEKLLPGGKSLE